MTISQLSFSPKYTYFNVLGNDFSINDGRYSNGEGFDSLANWESGSNPPHPHEHALQNLCIYYLLVHGCLEYI